MNYSLPPLRSPRPYVEFSPAEWKAYVSSLYREPIRAAAPKEFTASLNKKGFLTVRINRKEKFLMLQEVYELSRDIGWPLQKTWLALIKRRIEIRRPSVITGKGAARRIPQAKK